MSHLRQGTRVLFSSLSRKPSTWATWDVCSRIVGNFWRQPARCAVEAQWELGRGLRNGHVQQWAKKNMSQEKRRDPVKSFVCKWRPCCQHSNSQRQGVTGSTRISELEDSTIQLSSQKMKERKWVKKSKQTCEKYYEHNIAHLLI